MANIHHTNVDVTMGYSWKFVWQLFHTTQMISEANVTACIHQAAQKEMNTCTHAHTYLVIYLLNVDLETEFNGILN